MGARLLLAFNITIKPIKGKIPLDSQRNIIHALKPVIGSIHIVERIFWNLESTPYSKIDSVVMLFIKVDNREERLF